MIGNNIQYFLTLERMLGSYILYMHVTNLRGEWITFCMQHKVPSDVMIFEATIYIF